MIKYIITVVVFIGLFCLMNFSANTSLAMSTYAKCNSPIGYQTFTLLWSIGVGFGIMQGLVGGSNIVEFESKLRLGTIGKRAPINFGQWNSFIFSNICQKDIWANVIRLLIALAAVFSTMIIWIVLTPVGRPG